MGAPLASDAHGGQGARERRERLREPRMIRLEARGQLARALGERPFPIPEGSLDVAQHELELAPLLGREGVGVRERSMQLGDGVVNTGRAHGLRGSSVRAAARGDPPRRTATAVAPCHGIRAIRPLGIRRRSAGTGRERHVACDEASWAARRLGALPEEMR